MVDETASVHGLDDEEGRVYLFGLPPDMGTRTASRISAGLEDAFDEAEWMMFSGELESDMVVLEVGEEELEGLASDGEGAMRMCANCGGASTAEGGRCGQCGSPMGDG